MKFPLSVRFRSTWGRRRAGENLPAPPISLKAPADSYALGVKDSKSPGSDTKGYQSQQVYMTKEDAKRAVDARREYRRNLPVPLVTRLMQGGIKA